MERYRSLSSDVQETPISASMTSEDSISESAVHHALYASESRLEASKNNRSKGGRMPAKKRVPPRLPTSLQNKQEKKKRACMPPGKRAKKTHDSEDENSATDLTQITTSITSSSSEKSSSSKCSPDPLASKPAASAEEEDAAAALFSLCSSFFPTCKPPPLTFRESLSESTASTTPPSALSTQSAIHEEASNRLKKNVNRMKSPPSSGSTRSKYRDNEVEIEEPDEYNTSEDEIEEEQSIEGRGSLSTNCRRGLMMVDHTYTDYSVVDEATLKEIDDEEKALVEQGKSYDAAAMEAADEKRAAEGYRGKKFSGLNLTEDQEKDRVRKIIKLQKMIRGMGASRRNSGGVVQPFPEKLMDVLDRGDLDEILCWMPHGRSFIVHSPKVFTAEVLPRFFKQTKFMSFTRQLNLWGFKRITRGPDSGAYYHELFLRGRPRLCARMRRQKIKGTGIKLTPNPDAEPDFYEMARRRPLPPVKTEAKPLPPITNLAKEVLGTLEDIKINTGAKITTNSVISASTLHSAPRMTAPAPTVLVRGPSDNVDVPSKPCALSSDADPVVVAAVERARAAAAAAKEARKQQDKLKRLAAVRTAQEESERKRKEREAAERVAATERAAAQLAAATAASQAQQQAAAQAQAQAQQQAAAVAQSQQQAAALHAQQQAQVRAQAQAAQQQRQQQDALQALIRQLVGGCAAAPVAPPPVAPQNVLDIQRLLEATRGVDRLSVQQLLTQHQAQVAQAQAHAHVQQQQQQQQQANSANNDLAALIAQLTGAPSAVPTSNTAAGSSAVGKLLAQFSAGSFGGLGTSNQPASAVAAQLGGAQTFQGFLGHRGNIAAPAPPAVAAAAAAANAGAANPDLLAAAAAAAVRQMHEQAQAQQGAVAQQLAAALAAAGLTLPGTAAATGNLAGIGDLGGAAAGLFRR